MSLKLKVNVRPLMATIITLNEKSYVKRYDKLNLLNGLVDYDVQSYIDYFGALLV
ncbi:hypothetical protein PM10SUCC1_11990 [Propionigenium maris DSM 9537]|uniref:Uncharacterized protein n=1 Tax=Propionigenium maris DSM 9537 TaxID=1123000 RepID=A0A9W6LN95_9FUSO|nr:hypothetical protein PM10SUCC1_11990 [Propionigenium maris DSM 9537]